MRLQAVHLAILRSAALLVPAPERAEWYAEWRAELWYVPHSATRFCLGSFRDASWLRRNSPRPTTPHSFRLQSPFVCLLVLVILAAASLLLAHSFPAEGLVTNISGAKPTYAELLHPLNLPGLLLFSILEVLAAGPQVLFPLVLEERSANRSARHAGIGGVRCGFLLVKVALVTMIVFYGFAGPIGPGPIGPGPTDPGHIGPIGPIGLGIAAIAGFRWALTDQRQRCPVCLRLLSNPIEIGGPAQTFLGWYGTEYICTRGHGTLYVPGLSTSWHRAQRWQHLA